MLAKALTYDGFIEDQKWVYRWNDHEFGVTGIFHCFDPERIVFPNRLGIEPELRSAYSEPHENRMVVNKFQDEWPDSIPENFLKRVMRLRVGRNQ